MKQWIDFAKINARLIIKIAFFLFVLVMGVEFYLWVEAAKAGTVATAKPYGVEGFIPVAALVGLKYWLVSGQFDPVHPAGLFIFLTILVLSFLLGKAFCAWLCPFGTGCDTLNTAGHRVLKRSLRLPKWLDYVLRSLKYLLLAAFIYGVLIAMDGFMVSGFLFSEYNLIADVKMLAFVMAPSLTFLAIIGVVLVANFFGISLWCRYLCPYGALLGIVGWIGPANIKRHADKCIDCNKCTKACPTHLPVSNKVITKSPECYFCGECVKACPVDGALETRFLTFRLKPWTIGVLFLVLFVGATFVAKATGYWETSVPLETFKQIMPNYMAY